MKILFLTSRLPYPPYRGDKLRTWNLLKQAAKQHEVTLISFIQDESERKWVDALKPYCNEIHLVPLPMAQSLFNCVLAIGKDIPFQVAYFASSKMRKELNALIERVKPDVMHTHLIRMASYAMEHSSVPGVLDQTDSISLYLKRFKLIERNPLMKFLLSLEYKRMQAYERIVSRFDRVLVCSECDRRAINELTPTAKVEIIENGVDVHTLPQLRTEQPEPCRIIFTGNMSYFPNADGARFFVKEIFPLIKEKEPRAKLFIVGQNPPSGIRVLANSDIIVTGFVKDIYAEYRKSLVAVAPIRFGAGTQYKILEALALGIPTVSTSIGVEGLALRPEEEVLVADAPAQFAKAVLRLFADAQLRQKLSKTSEALILDKYNWDAIGKKLDYLYHAVADATDSTGNQH